MNAPISYRTDDPQAAQYRDLFETTGWNAMYRASAEELIAGLRASWHHVCAYDTSRLVATGRLLSDGILYAVMFDIIVDPQYQRHGIGSEIVQRLLTHCQDAGIRDILLFSAKGTEPFYRRFGFGPRPAEAPGMILRKTVSKD